MSNDDKTLFNSRDLESSDDNPSNPSNSPSFGDIVRRRMGRREFVTQSLAVSAMAGVFVASPGTWLSAEADENGGAPGPEDGFSFDFPELAAGVDESHHVADGYDAGVLIRWGDPVLPGAPQFDAMQQSAAAQERQFGYNNDFIGYTALPFGSENPDRGLLCINHEYTTAWLMFPNYSGPTPETAEIEMAAHGASIVEVARDLQGNWNYVPDSPFNRRISGRSTLIRISGPAAGHERMRTAADPTGTRVIGTFNNCAGGMTPWGTYLMAEENFHYYFGGELSAGHREAKNFERCGIPAGKGYPFYQYHERFNIGLEPHEPNRFGWIVEVDPYDPFSTPVKRTALGRFKHEGATCTVNTDGRLVVYSGDDQRFDYVYKFVSHGRYNPHSREANRTLLDSGTLFAARYHEDGSYEWLPLVFGTGPLTPDNGFNSQADVLIDTRLAADLLEATPMDRPEDVEANPKTGKVYVMLTNNPKRKPDDVDAVNPRGPNPYGHILEMTPDNGDHGSLRGSWDLLVVCGDPESADESVKWHPKITSSGWFAAPDNCVIDGQGRLWVCTDGNNATDTGRSDGVWALETEGDYRGLPRHFFRVPAGAEMCGPVFTPDDGTLFVAVQHPADNGEDWPAFGRESTFEDPSTRWPDFQPDTPPRPSVVAITRQGGGKIA